MIENADTFRYVGTIFTRQHEVQLFDEGLLIMALDGPLDPQIAPHASQRPMLTDAWLGWHPASPQKGAAARWSFVNADWGRQFRGPIDGRKSLPGMAKAFLDGRFDSKPALAGARSPVPVDLVLCLPVGDPAVTWQVLHWHGGLFTPAAGGITEQEARENLRHEDLALVRDTRRVVPPDDDRYLGQVAHGAMPVQVFSSGLLVPPGGPETEVGWYPLRTVGANLTAEGARLMEGAGHLADAAAQGFPFLTGLHDADPNDPGARYVWVGVDEEGERQGFMVFDQPLRAPGSPGFDALQGEARARSLRDVSRFAPAFDPNVIAQVDQLGRDLRWGVCGFVTAIQAAWYQAGRHDLLKPTSHATLVPVIRAFLDAYPQVEVDLMNACDGQLSFAEMKALMDQDTEMQCPYVTLGLDFVSYGKLAEQLGLQPDAQVLGGSTPLEPHSLPSTPGIAYAVGRGSHGGGVGGHQIYVKPDGMHLLWGRARTPAQAYDALKDGFETIGDIVRFD